jgi:hypothetical protein
MQGTLYKMPCLKSIIGAARKGKRMKLLLILIVAVLVSSCGRKNYLSVEETVRQCKVCETSGLFSEIHHDFSDQHVISVTCETYRFKSNLQYYAKVKIAAQDTAESTALRTTAK